MTEITTRWGTEEDVTAALDVLAIAYGHHRFDRAWFDWKHRRGPWGPSTFVLVSEDGEDIGVCFGLPWEYHRGDTVLQGIRVVDGGTTPAARGKGVLRRAIAPDVARWDPADRPCVLVATATPPARASHVKNGAVALDGLPHRWALPTALPIGRLVHGDDVLDGYVAPDEPRFHTRWSPSALRWRIDRSVGHSYEVAALAHADAPAGVVYRVVGAAPARLVVPVVTWGSGRSLGVLLASVLRSSKAVSLLTPVGVGSAPLPVRPVRRAKAEVLLCVWDQLGSTQPLPSTRLDSWAWTMADLEGVI